MIWLIGLAAVCLTSRHTSQRPVAVLILAASALTSVAFPMFYREVVAGSWTGCLLILARNGLLAAAAVLSFVRLWRSARPPSGKPSPSTQPRPDSDRLPDRALSIS